MKTFRRPHPTALRLAVLVTGAFIAVIAVWVTVGRLAARVDTHVLSPNEEHQILRESTGRKERP